MTTTPSSAYSRADADTHDIGTVNGKAINTRLAFGPGPPERIGADLALFEILRADGFTGPHWDRFTVELCRYALSVLSAWVSSGEISRRIAAVRIPFELGAAERFRLEHDRDFHDDIVEDTVAEALVTFRAQCVTGTGWRPEHGAAIKTYFIGRCTITFVNEMKKYRRAEARNHKNIAAAAREEVARVVDRAAEDPADHYADQQILRTYLLELSQSERNIVWGKVSGLTNREIAEIYGERSARSVEQKWSRLKARHRWIGRLGGGKE